MENELLEAFYSDWPKYKRLARSNMSKKKRLRKAQVEYIRELGATKRYSYDQIARKSEERYGVSVSQSWVGGLIKRGDKR